MSRFETLASKLEKKIKFTPNGWIILTEWVNKDTPREYLNTIKIDDKELAIAYLTSEPSRYRLADECKA
jgi:hypothetical protein